jgi:hypothetical protein
MKNDHFFLLLMLAIISSPLRSQNADTTIEREPIWEYNTIGVELFHAQHAYTSFLEDYTYDELSGFASPNYKQGYSIFLQLHPIPKWKFGLAYSKATSVGEIDLHDISPYDTLLHMYETIFSLDAAYLLMNKRDVHFAWLQMRTGYIKTKNDEYYLADSMPGLYGFPDYLSGRKVLEGNGMGVHLQMSMHYSWQFYRLLSLGLRAGMDASYIHHETAYTGSTSTPWTPGIYYEEEIGFNGIQYFAHVGIDLTLHFVSLR